MRTVPSRHNFEGEVIMDATLVGNGGAKLRCRQAIFLPMATIFIPDRLPASSPLDMYLVYETLLPKTFFIRNQHDRILDWLCVLIAQDEGPDFRPKTQTQNNGRKLPAVTARLTNFIIISTIFAENAAAIG